MFFSSQEFKAGPSNAQVFGATVWGWVAEDDEQGLLAYGGFWNPPNGMQSNGFISSDLSWIGNCTEGSTVGAGAVGTITNMGSARLLPNGFEYTTEQNTASVTYPVWYWAIGPSAPGANMWIMEV